MNVKNGYCDLCVPYNSKSAEMEKVLSEIFVSGFKTVAIEFIYDDRKKTTSTKSTIPDPIQLSFDNFKGKLSIIKRLTIIYSDIALLHAAAHSLALNKYDLVACQPTSESAFANACSTFPCDLITLAPDQSDVKISRKNFSIAVRRGIFFEIKYAPSIEDSNFRRKVIIQSQNFFVVGKSKNVIISSGATNPFFIRTPYDIANMGLIFGLSEEQSKHSMLGKCRTLLLRATARRHGKTSVLFSKLDIEQDDEDSDDEDEDSEAEDEDCEMEEPQPIKKIKFK